MTFRPPHAAIIAALLLLALVLCLDGTEPLALALVPLKIACGLYGMSLKR